MTLNQCYQCIKIDGQTDDDYSCEPYSTNYTVPYHKSVIEEGVVLACTQANPGNQCAIRTCCCDTNFVTELLDHFFSEVTFDPSLKHENNWSFEDNCPKKDGPGCDDCWWECCGVYPFRFPYRNKPGGTKKGCCGSTVYDMEKYECCPDESLKNMCPVETLK